MCPSYPLPRSPFGCACFELGVGVFLHALSKGRYCRPKMNRGDFSDVFRETALNATLVRRPLSPSQTRLDNCFVCFLEGVQGMAEYRATKNSRPAGESTVLRRHHPRAHLGSRVRVGYAGELWMREIYWLTSCERWSLLRGAFGQDLCPPPPPMKNVK